MSYKCQSNQSVACDLWDQKASWYLFCTPRSRYVAECIRTENNAHCSLHWRKYLFVFRKLIDMLMNYQFSNQLI